MPLIRTLPPAGSFRAHRGDGYTNYVQGRTRYYMGNAGPWLGISCMHPLGYAGDKILGCPDPSDPETLIVCVLARENLRAP